MLILNDTLACLPPFISFWFQMHNYFYIVLKFNREWNKLKSSRPKIDYKDNLSMIFFFLFGLNILIERERERKKRWDSEKCEKLKIEKDLKMANRQQLVST